MRVGILIPTLSGRDAVSTDAIQMVDALRVQGYEAELFADNSDHVSYDVRKAKFIHDYLRGPRDVVLYHYSIGWDFANQLLRTTQAKRVIKYHNITPPHFFEPYSKDYVHACHAGRATISEMVRLNCELYLADSAYNLSELVEHGLEPGHGAVVPPFNRLDHLLDEPADLPFLDRYNDGTTNLLMVGRLAPNKGHLALLEAFAYYQREFEQKARLFLIGKQDTRLSRYNNQIHERIARYGLSKQVVMLDDVNEAQLKAAYLCTDAFIILSEHEGFCVPLIEAMALNVPIIAYGSSAIPDTVGDAGLVWESADPVLIASAIHHVCCDADTRRILQSNGKARYQSKFTHSAITETFLRALENLQ